MADTDYTVGGVPVSNLDTGKFVIMKRVMNAAAIIASDATLTAAAKITAAEVIQAIDVPAGFYVTGTGIYVTTAGTAGNTVDIGFGGQTDSFQNGADIVSLGKVSTLLGDTYGSGWLFPSADTIDVIYVADEIIGQFTLAVTGYQMF